MFLAEPSETHRTGDKVLSKRDVRDFPGSLVVKTSLPMQGVQV